MAKMKLYFVCQELILMLLFVSFVIHNFPFFLETMELFKLMHTNFPTIVL